MILKAADLYGNCYEFDAKLDTSAQEVIAAIAWITKLKPGEIKLFFKNKLVNPLLTMEELGIEEGQSFIFQKVLARKPEVELDLNCVAPDILLEQYLKRELTDDEREKVKNPLVRDGVNMISLGMILLAQNDVIIA